ncbi:MAG: helix-turn-helix transcriptional regulator [Mesosutterella multiformis]|nr:helix-turn-helix transcriptional regulator [Mesosutterella multiformis]
MKTIDTRQKERARRLSQLLKASSLKQIEIAEALGVPPSSVSKWGLGQTVPTGARLEALASLLGVSADYIRTGKDDGAVLASASDCSSLAVRSLNSGGRDAALKALTVSAPLLALLGIPDGAAVPYMVDSDAMAPAIPADAIALVDTSTDAPASRGAFSEGIYLIENAEGARRLARLIYTPAGAVFISDNPAYQRDPVPVDKTTIRGRVKALIRVEII